MKKEENKTYNSDVTKEDLNALGERKQNERTSQLGDDAQLANREKSVDFTGKDLDIPGRNSKPSQQSSKLKDEENELYSQGSGHNDHLEDADNH